MNGKRSYAIPLGLLSGFFRMKNYLPLMGNRLRVNFGLTKSASDVISFSTTAAPANQSFTLNNVSILMDTVICTPKYADAVRSVMQTGEGLRLPFTSLQTGTHQVAASASQYMRIANSNSNSMSLFLLYDDKVAKEQEPDKWSLSRQAYALPKFSSLRVRCGTKSFTPPDDIRSFTELYTSVEKCVNSVCDITGSGWIDYQMYTGDYVQGANVSGGKYGLCLMGVNLEKTIETDDAVINNGLAAIEAGNSDFDITLQTATALNNQNTFRWAISHKRALVFAAQGVVVSRKSAKRSDFYAIRLINHFYAIRLDRRAIVRYT